MGPSPWWVCSSPEEYKPLPSPCPRDRRTTKTQSTKGPRLSKPCCCHTRTCALSARGQQLTCLVDKGGRVPPGDVSEQTRSYSGPRSERWMDHCTRAPCLSAAECRRVLNSTLNQRLFFYTQVKRNVSPLHFLCPLMKYFCISCLQPFHSMSLPSKAVALTLSCMLESPRSFE